VQACLHFSSLCKDVNLLNINDYKNDCKRLSELTEGKIADIRLLEGEPLLHPEVNEFIAITRKYFPNIDKAKGTGIIELVSNGILLSKQNDKFWINCRDNNIRIVILEYPIKIEREIIKEKVNVFNLDLIIYSEGIKPKSTGSANRWAKIPIGVKGLQDHKKSFGKYFLAGNCFQLIKRKIFKCTRIAYINYFNVTFNQCFEIGKDDYVDIYKIKNINEILHLLLTPARFCRYCKTDDIYGKANGKYPRGI